MAEESHRVREADCLARRPVVPRSSDGSFYLAGCRNLQQKGSLPPSATRNYRADICPGDSGIISGDTLS
jgi:hypothetical protein